jgi:hypothetical protein
MDVAEGDSEKHTQNLRKTKSLIGKSALPDLHGVIAAILSILVILGAIMALDGYMGQKVSRSAPVTLTVNDGVKMTRGQVAIKAEIDRKLGSWLGTAQFYNYTGIICGAIAATLTVIIGMMEGRSFSKMLLMGISAGISFLIGTVQPSERYVTYMSAWRNLYGEVQTFNAKQQEPGDFAELSQKLSELEHSLSGASK